MASWKNLVIIGGFALATLAGCQSEETDASNNALTWQIDEQIAEEAATLAEMLKNDDSMETVTDPKLEKAYLSLVEQHPIADLVVSSLYEQGCEVDDEDALVLSSADLSGPYTLVDLTGVCDDFADAEMTAVISNGLTADVVEITARIIEENNELWSVVHDLSNEGNEEENEEEETIEEEEEEEAQEPGIPFQTTTLLVDEGVVFASGEVIDDGSGFKVDLVVHKHGSGLDVKGGRQGTDYQPIADFGALTYSNIADVPCQAPNPSNKNAFKGKLAPGQGLTVTGNISAGFYRVRIVQATTSYLTIEYAPCQ